MDFDDDRYDDAGLTGVQEDGANEFPEEGLGSSREGTAPTYLYGAEYTHEFAAPVANVGCLYSVFNPPRPLENAVTPAASSPNDILEASESTSGETCALALPPSPSSRSSLSNATAALEAAASGTLCAIEELPEFPTPTVQNVIASVNLCCTLDLRAIAISARNVEYNPRRINAVVVRLRRPKCTALVFRSGRMMLCGARSVSDAHLGGKKVAKLVKVVGHPDLRFCNFKIDSLVASVDCGFPVRLEGLAHDHSLFCSYEPEIFSGLVYRYNLPHRGSSVSGGEPDNFTDTSSEVDESRKQQHNKAVLLVFVSGKVVITGCRTAAAVNRIFKAIFPVLAQYRK